MHSKFIIIEPLQNINTTLTESLKLGLREREIFGIKKLLHNMAYTKNLPYYVVPAIFTLP